MTENPFERLGEFAIGETVRLMQEDNYWPDDVPMPGEPGFIMDYITTRYGTKKEGTNMDIISREEILRQRIEDAEMELLAHQQLQVKYGKDSDYPNGTVIRFEYQFNGTSNWYNYAAIKCEVGWYTTGPRTLKAKDWDAMVRWFEHGRVRNLKVAKTWKRI